MNIAMVQSTPYPPEEGIGNYVSNLSQKLIDRGHSVDIITRGGLQREEVRADGLRVVRLPCPPLYPFHVDLHGLFVNRWLRSETDRLDLIHVHTPLTPVIDSQVPLVSTIHTSVIEDVKHVDGWTLRDVASKLTLLLASKRLVAGQSAAAARITTTSEPVSRELSRYYGIDDAVIIGNGVDADRFHPGDSEDRQEGRYVLYVGRLDSPKGVPDLLDAAASVVHENELDVVITGKGPHRGRLEQQAKELDIDDRVRFTGYVSRERQIRLYQNAMAFVLPSHYEGLPTVLLEAMASGAPVIATEVGGCPEVITDGDNGLLVSPGDPPALADAMERLIHDAQFRERLGTNARRTILDRYTWETITDAFEREYRLAMETE